MGLCVQRDCLLNTLHAMAGTNLEDEDVLSKNVLDIDGRTVRTSTADFDKMLQFAEQLIATADLLIVWTALRSNMRAELLHCVKQPSLTAVL